MYGVDCYYKNIEYLFNNVQCLLVIMDKKLLIDARFSNDQLRRIERLVSLGTLISGIAHEINNPNTFVMSNSGN